MTRTCCHHHCDILPVVYDNSRRAADAAVLLTTDRSYCELNVEDALQKPHESSRRGSRRGSSSAMLFARSSRFAFVV